jgi:hypothetical protein
VRRGDGLELAVALGGLEEQLRQGARVVLLDASREALGDLLEGPRVAVGVGEGRAAEVRAALRVDAVDAALAGLEVPDLADLDAAGDQVVPGGDDVVDRRCSRCPRRTGSTPASRAG